MPRPSKCKRICQMPSHLHFEAKEMNEYVLLSVEEYETIRLIDKEGLTQEECAKRMNAARTTIQSLYASARYKIADYLTSGKGLIVTGGNYELCPKHENCKHECMHSCCHCKQK